MNKNPMTQGEYEKKVKKLDALRLKLKNKDITKEEAIKTMIVSMGYGKTRAGEIVTKWTKSFYGTGNVRHYNPNPIVKISRQVEMTTNEHDLPEVKELK